MTLGEIKVEALKLMFAQNKEDIDTDCLESLELREEYGDYLGGMVGSINRCFAVIEEHKVLPVKSVSLPCSDRVSIFDVADDVSDIKCIVCEWGGGYNSNCAFYREEDTVIIPEYDERCEYRLLYYPLIPRIFSHTGNDHAIDIPDRIACHIPYFIKSELFRVDEPDEAGEARNLFDSAMRNMGDRGGFVQSRVNSVYSFTEV